jgi:hypothetical protein
MSDDDNNNVASINDLVEADAAWDQFFGRFYSSDIPKGVDVKFDPLVREFKPRQNKNAKNLPPFQMEGRTDHSDDFDDFLNGNTVKIPESITLNKKMLHRVKMAIYAGDFSGEIFKKIDHIYYALWLFKQNKITRQQMSTILATWQVSSLVENNQSFDILDEMGEFTPEALDLLIPVIKKHSYHGQLTSEQLERFRLLLMAAPKSERIFHMSDPIKDLVVKNKRTQLGGALIRNKGWYRIGGNDELGTGPKDMHLSFGTMEALQIAITGTQRAAANRAVIGKVGIDGVKAGVDYHFRPTAIDIPESGVKATTKGIEGYADSPMPVVTMHDFYHSRLHTTIPPEFHLMINHMYQAISKHTKQKWSKVLWEIVDREFLSFYDSKQLVKLSSKNGAKYFNEMFKPSKRHYFFIIYDI